MSRSVNKVTLIGTVGRDPEPRTLPSGSTVVNISLATNDSYMDKNSGQRVEQTEWHRVVAFGKLADIIQQYVRKGGRLYIEGKLRTNEWEKDGIKRYTTEIVVNEMVMLDRPQQDQGGYAPQNYAAPQQPAYQAPAPAQQPPAYQNQAYPNPAYAAPAPAPQGAPSYPQNPGYAAPAAAPQPAPVPPAPTAMPQHNQSYASAPMPAPAPAQNNFDSTEDDIPF